MSAQDKVVWTDKLNLYFKHPLIDNAGKIVSNEESVKLNNGIHFLSSENERVIDNALTKDIETNVDKFRHSQNLHHEYQTDGQLCGKPFENDLLGTDRQNYFTPDNKDYFYSNKYYPGMELRAVEGASPVTDKVNQFIQENERNRDSYLSDKEEGFNSDSDDHHEGKEADDKMLAPVSRKDAVKFMTEKQKKIGHRRVDEEGKVSYKKVESSQLLKAIQLGLNHSIGSLSSKPQRDVLMQDFTMIEVVTFPKEGSSTTAAHEFSEFRFKTYAPVAFRYFRELFGIKTEDFLISLCAKPPRELSNPGASGSVFFVTCDDEFILKTVQRKEASFLEKLLPGYYMNLNQNPRTLLPKFFGLYCYQSGGKNIRLLIMNNLIPSSLKIHEKYDLKGSTYKRKASKYERLKSNPTFKDLDFLEKHPSGIMLESETYDALIKTLKRDCLVLESFKIMDYSLLMGVHNIDMTIRERELQAKEKVCRERQDMLHSPLGGSAESQYSDEPQVWDSEKPYNAAKQQIGVGRPIFGTEPNPPPLSPVISSGAGFLTINSPKTNINDVPKSRVTAYSTAMESIHAPQSSGNAATILNPDPLDYEEHPNDTPPGGIPARNAQGERLLCFIGIIDILQCYEIKKRLEHTFKSIFHDGDTVSVHRPSFYAQRFKDFLNQRVFKKIPSPTVRHQAPSTMTSHLGAPSLSSSDIVQRPFYNKYPLSPTPVTAVLSSSRNLLDSGTEEEGKRRAKKPGTSLVASKFPVHIVTLPTDSPDTIPTNPNDITDSSRTGKNRGLPVANHSFSTPPYEISIFSNDPRRDGNSNTFRNQHTKGSSKSFKGSYGLDNASHAGALFQKIIYDHHKPPPLEEGEQYYYPTLPEALEPPSIESPTTFQHFKKFPDPSLSDKLNNFDCKNEETNIPVEGPLSAKDLNPKPIEDGMMMDLEYKFPPINWEKPPPSDVLMLDQYGNEFDMEVDRDIGPGLLERQRLLGDSLALTPITCTHQQRSTIIHPYGHDVNDFANRGDVSTLPALQKRPSSASAFYNSQLNRRNLPVILSPTTPQKLSGRSFHESSNIVSSINNRLKNNNHHYPAYSLTALPISSPTRATDVTTPESRPFLLQEHKDNMRHQFFENMTTLSIPSNGTSIIPEKTKFRPDTPPPDYDNTSESALSSTSVNGNRDSNKKPTNGDIIGFKRTTDETTRFKPSNSNKGSEEKERVDNLSQKIEDIERMLTLPIIDSPLLYHQHRQAPTSPDDSSSQLLFKKHDQQLQHPPQQQKYLPHHNNTEKRCRPIDAPPKFVDFELTPSFREYHHTTTTTTTGPFDFYHENNNMVTMKPSDSRFSMISNMSYGSCLTTATGAAPESYYTAAEEGFTTGASDTENDENYYLSSPNSTFDLAKIPYNDELNNDIVRYSNNSTPVPRKSYGASPPPPTTPLPIVFKKPHHYPLPDQRHYNSSSVMSKEEQIVIVKRRL